MPPLFPVEKVSKKISILISNMKIEHKIQETIQKFNLINKKDKILVAASGGKTAQFYHIY